MVELKIFTMRGCGYCTQLKEHLEEKQVQYTDLCVDCGDDWYAEQLAQKFGVNSFPTLFFVKDNKILNAQVGFAIESQNIAALLEEYNQN